jgi:copper chaperone CopZ
MGTRTTLCAAGLVLALGVAFAQDDGATQTNRVSLRIDGMNDMNASSTLATALRGVPGVLDVEPRFEQSAFDVRFRPGEATLDQLFEAVSRTGYRPQQEGPVIASIGSEALKVEARAMPLWAGEEAELIITLLPAEGVRLAGDDQPPVLLTLMPSGAIQAATEPLRLTESIIGRRELELPLTALQDAPPGETTIALRITTQGVRDDGGPIPERTLELQVPVTILPPAPIGLPIK